MQARDRKLKEWFNVIRSGRLRLPRFQRGEEWTPNEVENLLNSLLRDLPVGAALVLEVGNEEPFVSRAIVGAPEPTERAIEHLLDGQQRLTTLWRAFHGSYERQSYYVRLPPTEQQSEPLVEVVGRWLKGGQRYPVWADSPKEQHRRSLVPLPLFRPEDLGGEIRQWCDGAADGGIESRELELRVQELRARIAEFNIPFLSLPTTTPRETALDVFIKMNTSFVKLTPFDIVVAQVEGATGSSLADLVGQLKAEVPEVEQYDDPSDLVLNVATLREDRAPTQASAFNLDPERLVEEWSILVDGVRWMVDILDEERVFDETRLPSVAVLAVVAALHEFVPPALDERANARRLIGKYIWRGFLTQRYTSAAATGALQDYRGLKQVLTAGGSEESIPILDAEEHPYPTTVEDLLRLRWPRKRPIVARGVLAVSLRAGARDIADAALVSRASIGKREYHHLFPDHLLRGDGQLTWGDSFQALNCALITWNTNRNIGAKEPIEYLAERTTRSGLDAGLGEQLIRDRLASHLVPYDELAVGGYGPLERDEDRADRIQKDYRRFLEARAEMMLPAIRTLCEGGSLPTV